MAPVYFLNATFLLHISNTNSKIKANSSVSRNNHHKLHSIHRHTLHHWSMSSLDSMWLIVMIDHSG